MVPWKKTLTIPSLRKNDHRTGLQMGLKQSLNPYATLRADDIEGSDVEPTTLRADDIEGRRL